MPIIDIQRRLTETGRIRIGEQVPTGNGNKTRPAKLETFRLTSRSEGAIRAAAGVYGGTPEIWADAPHGTKQWQLFTAVDQLGVLLPPEQMSFSQFYEIWSGGGCQVRCTGAELVPSGAPCMCDPEDRKCKAHTRLSVILSDLSGAGLWRLDTQGWNAAVEIGGAFGMAKLIAQASQRSIIPAILRLDQREIKRPDEPIKRFAVPVLEFSVNLVALTGAGAEPQAISSGQVTPVPGASDARSLADEIKAIETKGGPKPRANSAEPLKPTGLTPRPLSAMDGDEEDGDILPPGARPIPNEPPAAPVVAPEVEVSHEPSAPAAPKARATREAKTKEPTVKSRGNPYISQPQIGLLAVRLRLAGIAEDDALRYLSELHMIEFSSIADLEKSQMNATLEALERLQMERES